jgi:hypothetical protein
MKINKPLRARLNSKLIRAGLDGNTRWKKPGSAWAEIFNIFVDDGVVSDDIPQFRGPSGTERVSLRPLDDEGAEYEDSLLVITWHQLAPSSYEVVAYVS